jgi:hypothetical protein
MAEGLGVAASIAGIVAIAGQLVSGCLFVKTFLNDTKSAPDDIRALHTEIAVLGGFAEKIQATARDANLTPQLAEDIGKRCNSAEMLLRG